MWTYLSKRTYEFKQWNKKNATFYVLLQVVCRNCFLIGQNSSISQLKAFANSQNKPNHTKRRGIKNCARKWYLFFCSIWFVVTWALWKMCEAMRDGLLQFRRRRVIKSTTLFCQTVNAPVLLERVFPMHTCYKSNVSISIFSTEVCEHYWPEPIWQIYMNKTDFSEIKFTERKDREWDIMRKFLRDENESSGGKLRVKNENESSGEKMRLRMRLLNFQEWGSD